MKFETFPEDLPWMWRQAYLKDPAGNRLVLYRAAENRRYPPWLLDETNPQIR
jgi:hydroxymethylpyrimidine/phosphomethylpyrimidine kinase